MALHQERESTEGGMATVCCCKRWRAPGPGGGGVQAVWVVEACVPRGSTACGFPIQRCGVPGLPWFHGSRVKVPELSEPFEVSYPFLEEETVRL